MFVGKTEANTGIAKVLIPAKSYICGKAVAYAIEGKSASIREKYTHFLYRVVLFLTQIRCLRVRLKPTQVLQRY